MSPSSSEVSICVVTVLLRSGRTAPSGGAPRTTASPDGPPEGPEGSVGGLVQQRLQGRVLQRLRGGGVVEHLLERLLEALALDDLGHGPAAQVVEVAGRGALHGLDDLLETADGLLDVRLDVGVALVEALDPARGLDPRGDSCALGG